MKKGKFTIKTLNQDGARFLSINGTWVGYRKNARVFSSENAARKVALKLKEEEVSIVREDSKFYTAE